MSSSDAENGFTGLEAAIVLIAFVVVHPSSPTPSWCRFSFLRGKSVDHSPGHPAGRIELHCNRDSLRCQRFSKVIKIHHYSYRPHHWRRTY